MNRAATWNAFPLSNVDIAGVDQGLTYRDYFAGIALQGILARATPAKVLGNVEAELAVKNAVMIADYLLAELYPCSSPRTEEGFPQ